jgi:S1-C subfamily serine protease
MSENEKDNKDFEFIKEQVIEKKRRKVKRWLLPLMMTVFMAVLFGMIAAVTFVITEPRLYKLLHKEEEIKTPVSFPTEYPLDTSIGNQVDTDTEKEDDVDTSVDTEDVDEPAEPETVIMEQSIDADIEDFVNMYDEIRTVAYQSNKSLLKVSTTTSVEDWFGDMVERTVSTTGLVISDINDDLLVLVSLDRVKDASSIKIELSDTIAVDAVLQDYDTETNLAIIAVALKDIPPNFMKNIDVATLGESYTLTVGSPILALGSPNGHPGSMELGIITSRGSWASITDNRIDLFNTSVENNDNSDGVIVNMKGEVIGLITRTLKDGVNEELSTVIGISKLKPIIKLIANQTPRIYFGVEAEDMTEAAKLEHIITNGIYINEVRAKSPAFEAGMKNGDIILQVDDHLIMNTNNFNTTISEYLPEDEVLVKIKRTSGTTEKELELKVVLAEKKK